MGTPPSQLGRKRSEETLAKLRAARARQVSHRRKRPYESLYNHFLYVARRRQIPVPITFEDFVVFTEIKQCSYCGNPVTWAEYSWPKNGAGYNLDRKLDADGYTVGNVVVACKVCNGLRRGIPGLPVKGAFAHEELVVMMKALLSYRQSRQIEY